MINILVSINYNFAVNLDGKNSEEKEKEFLKLKEIINKDTEKFILANIDNPNAEKQIFFELGE